MVQKHYSAADIAAGRVIVRCHERTHARVGPDDTCGGKGRHEFAAFAQQQLHFLLCNPHIIALVERHLVGGGTDYADHIARYEDIRIGRLAAAVHHHIGDPVAKDQQRALGR